MDGTLKISSYKVGGTQKPYSFTETQYFFEKKMLKYYPKPIKAESMTQFDIFHTLLENAVK